MPEATITVRPNGADALSVSGIVEATETETGWRVQMMSQPSLAQLQPEWVAGEPAIVVVNEMHYAGKVVEYHPAEGKIVVEGDGPPPA
jgi:hypothetical protein